MKNKLKNFVQKCVSICVNTYKDYSTALNDVVTEMELMNEVAALSNYVVADELMYTVKQIAYINKEPNHETICKYLNQAIKDLLSGMSAVDVLGKYDKILYDMKNPKQKHRGYRAEILIVDDLCDTDKEELKETIKNAEQKVIDFCGCNLKT